MRTTKSSGFALSGSSHCAAQLELGVVSNENKERRVGSRQAISAVQGRERQAAIGGLREANVSSERGPASGGEWGLNF